MALSKSAKSNSQWQVHSANKLLQHISADELLDGIAKFSKTLKDDKRSLVKLGELKGIKTIAKKPRDKNRRKWSRLLSLVRDGEAKKSAKTLLEFERLGIPSVRPLAVLEKRQFGMIIDSWFIYEYRDGEPVKLLLNFLSDGEQVFLIDCKGRPRIGRFSDYYDYFLLSDRNAEINDSDIDAWVDFDKSSFAYRLASLYRGYKSTRTKLKNRIRSKK